MHRTWNRLANLPWWTISVNTHILLLVFILPLVTCESPDIPAPLDVRGSLAPAAEVPELVEAPRPRPEARLRERPAVPKLERQDPGDVPDVAPDEPSEPDPAGLPDRHGREGQLIDRLNNAAIGSGPAAGSAFGHRSAERRKALLEAGGGGADTESSVLMGQTWLSRHQAPDGRWDSQFAGQCEKGHNCSGPGTKAGAPAMTGLATLTFLGTGDTHRSGRFKDTIKRALRYLMRIQRGDGSLGTTNLYHHAIATLALCEAYGMAPNPYLRKACARAVKFLLLAQNLGTPPKQPSARTAVELTGNVSDKWGFRYSPRCGTNDVSVTGWCVMAMKSARDANVPVNGIQNGLDGALNFIESLTDGRDYKYITGYSRRPPRGYLGGTSNRFGGSNHAVSHAPTAVAAMCRVFKGYDPQHRRVLGAARVIATMPPTWDPGGNGRQSQIDFYYWYHGTLAMFQIGGEQWKRWNKHLKPTLIDHQLRAGCERGSWDPIGAWGVPGGRVYTTAINVLNLEVYYRYPKVFH